MRTRGFLLGLTVLAILSVVFAPGWGSVSIDAIAEGKRWLGPREAWTGDTRIFELRLSRVALAFLAGGALACAGAVLQTLLRNGLATPFTLGVASAGSFGAFLVLAHDQAVMREDRGYWNLPEVHLGMSFPRPLMSVIDARLSHGERRRAVLVGHRYTGPDAARAGIVDAVAPRESLVEEVVERVSAVSGSAGENLSLIKRQLYPEIASIAAS